MKHILLMLCLAVACLAADETPPALPPLPDTVTLKNGAVLKKVSVIRWQKDAVVLKHQGGADPIRFEHMSPESRALFEAHKGKGLAGESAKKNAIQEQAAAQESARAANERKRKLIEDAISSKDLVLGMTESEAIQSWGRPDKINASGGAGGRNEQWIYYRRPGDTWYLYFKGGVLTSWQK